jgi:hypothetical protein
MKLGIYVMAPEPISTAYSINPSPQSVSICVSLLILPPSIFWLRGHSSRLGPLWDVTLLACFRLWQSSALLTSASLEGETVILAPYIFLLAVLEFCPTRLLPLRPLTHNTATTCSYQLVVGHYAKGDRGRSKGRRNSTCPLVAQWALTPQMICGLIGRPTWW